MSRSSTERSTEWLARLPGAAGSSALTQSGQTQHYALGMTLGAVVILTVYLLF